MSEGLPRHASTESPPHRLDTDGLEWQPRKIRKGGTLERTFRYYASYKCGEEVAMTPEDMMRSLAPQHKPARDHQNDDYIGEENFIEITRDRFKALRKRTRASDGSFFQRRPEDGPTDQPYLLITFPEYHLFLTILSTAMRNIEVAFHMFDVNNNGSISLGEFYRVMTYVRESSAEMFDRGGTTKKGVQKLEIGLLRRLFGVDKTRQGVNYPQFREAVLAIRDELGKMEYEDLAGGPGEVMTERAFAVAMLSFIRSGKLKDALTGRAEQLSEARFVGWDKWLGYLELKDNISALEDALRMHTDAGLSVDKKTFQRAIRATNGSELDGEVLDIIFTIFDENGDGCLSHQEFVAVIKTSQGFGLKQPPNHQLKSGLKGLLKCWVDRMTDGH